MDPFASAQDCDSQVPSSRPSLSCPSEPPDLGNWFSSYEYRSPDPNYNSSFEDSDFRGRRSQRDEKDEEEANPETRQKLLQLSGTCVAIADDKRNEDPCLNKNLDSFSSRSLLSEPPDIRNWFSSYVYESPVCDASGLFSDAVSEENESKEERFYFEGRSDNVHPKGCEENNSSSDQNMKVEQPSSRGDGSVEKEKILTTPCTSDLEKRFQPCMQDKALLHNFGPTKHEETSGQNHGSPDCNREAHIMSLDIDNGSDYNCTRTPEMVQKNDIREKNLKAKIPHDKLDTSASLAKAFSTVSSTCTRNKENDGFVTTRKNKYTGANDGSSWKKPEKVLLQCSTNKVKAPLTCEKHAVTKRKALTEATNLQQSNDMEITGKWRFPQKGKPYLGPAMKQLRLEQWVQRI